MLKILNREGSKARYINEIIPLFPPHELYIEPFLGTGAIFLNKRLSKYNVLNDRSDFIYKFWNCYIEDRKRLIENIHNTFIHEKILLEKNYRDTYDEVARKLLMQHNGLYGRPNTLRSAGFCRDDLIYKLSIDAIFEKIRKAKIFNRDVFDFINCISFRNEEEIKQTFIYCDPPYSISKGYLKDNKGWGIDKLEELIDLLQSKKWAFMISEFAEEKVLELFKNKNLGIVYISKSKGVAVTKGLEKMEIVATNYITKQNLFDTFS